MTNDKQKTVPMRKKLSSSQKMDLAAGIGTAIAIPAAYIGAKRLYRYKKVTLPMRRANQLKSALRALAGTPVQAEQRAAMFSTQGLRNVGGTNKQISKLVNARKQTIASVKPENLSRLDAAMYKMGYLTKEQYTQAKAGVLTAHREQFLNHIRNFSKNPSKSPVMVQYIEDGKYVLKPAKTSEEAIAAYLKQSGGIFDEDLKKVLVKLREKKIKIANSKAEGWSKLDPNSLGQTKYKLKTDRELYEEIYAQAKKSGWDSLPANPAELLYMKNPTTGRGRFLKDVRKGKYNPPKEYLKSWKAKE